MTDKSFKYLSWFLLLGIVLLYLNNASAHLFIQDDSFTTFTYVKNFLNGNGLVFNISEKVEGYTNFLWIIILSAVGYAGLDIVSWSQILSIAFGGINLVLIYFITIQLLESSNGRNRLLGLIPPLLLAFDGGYIYWSVSAMETSLFLCLFFLLFFIAIRENYRTGIKFYLILLFLSFCRPEGIYYGFILLLIILLKNKPTSINQLVEIVNIKKALVFLLPFILYLIWKYFYYGNLLPNTFYAKTGFGIFYLQRGTGYLVDTFAFQHYYLFLPFVLLLLVKKKNFEVIALFLLIIANLINVLLVGGDVLPLNRFSLITFILLFILFTLLLNNIEPIRKKFYSVIIVVLLLCISWFNFSGIKYKVDQWRSFELGLVHKMKEYSKWLQKEKAEKGRELTVALSTIGALKYYSGCRVIDLIGLTDSYISHHPKEVEGIAGNISVLWKERRYNVDYILNEEPDYIIFPAGLKPSAYPEAAMFYKEKFYNEYYPQLIYSGEFDELLPVYSRKPGHNEQSNVNITNCDVDFVENYILASNHLLEMNEINKNEKTEVIRALVEKASAECEWRRDQPLTILGMAYYHAGDKNIAKDYFEASYSLNEFNTPALWYLMKLNFEMGDSLRGYSLLHRLNKISPDCLPGIIK
ncbi:MAG: hypothetical protein D6830_03415 [Ignavibacteria bacterium]|nr:MAG: hypothetical protein D6830_03415 [Ignavibacteria bacterium]